MGSHIPIVCTARQGSSQTPSHLLRKPQPNSRCRNVCATRNVCIRCSFTTTFTTSCFILLISHLIPWPQSPLQMEGLWLGKYIRLKGQANVQAPLERTALFQPLLLHAELWLAVLTKAPNYSLVDSTAEVNWQTSVFPAEATADINFPKPALGWYPHEYLAALLATLVAKHDFVVYSCFVAMRKQVARR